MSQSAGSKPLKSLEELIVSSQALACPAPTTDWTARMRRWLLTTQIRAAMACSQPLPGAMEAKR